MTPEGKKELIGLIENVLFAAGEACDIEWLAAIADVEAATLEEVLAEETEARKEGSGLVFMRFGEKVQLATRPEYGDKLADIFGRNSKEDMSQAMMETLAIVAYRQPVTRQEIESIRGVNSSYMINELLERGLIQEQGRKEVLGRPKLYATDTAFLRHFGIASVNELPALPEDEKPEIEEEFSI